jgi:hypothetical protein
MCTPKKRHHLADHTCTHPNSTPKAGAWSPNGSRRWLTAPTEHCTLSWPNCSNCASNPVKASENIQGQPATATAGSTCSGALVVMEYMVVVQIFGKTLHLQHTKPLLQQALAAVTAGSSRCYSRLICKPLAARCASKGLHRPQGLAFSGSCSRSICS